MTAVAMSAMDKQQANVPMKATVGVDGAIAMLCSVLDTAFARTPYSRRAPCDFPLTKKPIY